MEALNKELKEKAISLGLCEQWQHEWKSDSNYFELLDKFKRGQDFCIKHDFPSLEFFRDCNEAKPYLEPNGVFLDELPSYSSSRLENDTYVCLGECEGDMHFGRWGTAVVYLRHQSKIRIIADEFSKISVRLYDDSSVIIDSDSSASVRVFDYREL